MPVVGDAYVIVRAVTTGFQRDVQNALRRANLQQAGQQAAQTFNRGFSGGLTRNAKGLAGAFADIRANGRAAADAFRRLVTVGYFLGPGIAALVGGVGALASGLVILVSQVSAAIPSLMALGGAMAALAFAMVAVKMGFSGIGEALKARSKEAKGAGKDNEAALRRIEDAERSLARVIESNRESLVRAKRDLADAEEALTEARKEAAESLQQLDFDAEDAALSETRASLELEKARERLQRVQDLPPNSRARREAELAFAETELNLRRAKDRNADLAKEQDEASKKRVEGSKEVLDATRRLDDARQDLARTERDGLRAQVDAERELARAREDANKGGRGGGAADDAFGKLIPEAQAFVDLLIKIKKQFKAVREEVQRELLPRIGEALSLLVDSYFPTLETLLPRVGEAVGNAAKKFAEIMAAPDVIKSFGDVGETSIYFIDQMGIVTGNLAVAVLKLLDAAGPLTRKFADWLVTLTGGWAESMTLKEKTGELTETFNYAGEVAGQLGDIFNNIGTALMNIGRAATGPGSAGEMLLTSFENATAKFAEFTGRIEADGTLEEYFKRVVPNVEAIGRLFNGLVMAFLRLADDEGVGAFADKLNSAVTTITEALGRLLEGAPALGEFVDKFVEFMALFAESDSIQNFFSVLNFGLDIMTAIFSNDMVMKVTMSVTAFLGFVKALTLMKNLGMTTLTILMGYAQKFGDLLMIIPGVSGQMNKLTGAFRNAGVAYTMTGGGLTGMRNALYTLGASGAGPILIVIAAIAALVAIFVLAWQNSEKFRDAVMGLVTAVRDALGEAVQKIVDEINKFFPSIESLGDIFRVIGDVLAVTLVPLLKFVLTNAIGSVGTAIVGFIRVVGGITTIFKAVWDVIKGFFAALRGDTDRAKELFESAFRNLVNGLKNIFSGIVNIIFAPFRLGFNLIARQWNNTVGKLTWSVPRWVPIIGGQTVGAPKLPELALGGTVFPSEGGTLVRVAEAGRPERIEPLDAQGLSRRDRAIIDQLAGGRGGQVFNVYPSPGMDERELAAMISRQLAFQLRAGAV
jgi:phage-related protein